MTTQISCWQTPPQRLLLATNQLHLWRISLQVSAATQRTLQSLLSSDELAREARLYDRQKAADFIVARGRLRQILGNYLHLPPVALAFRYGREGKPALHPEFCATVAFNLSHSGAWALLAVTAGTAVGVDLERIDPLLDCQKIARQFFNPTEINLFNNFSHWRQRRGFYRIWTGKEAGLKRSGFGFSAPASTAMDQLVDQARLFPISKNYLGAIVTSARIKSIQRYQLNDLGCGNS